MSQKNRDSNHPITSEKISQLISVAEMYYNDNKTQQEIARIIGVSRTQVSKLLKKSREMGLVKISIKHPNPRVSAIEEKMKKRYGLKDVIIVPRSMDKEDIIYPILGRAAAEYLEKEVSKGEVIGIGRGRSVYETLSSLSEDTMFSPTFVPLAGGLGQADSNYPVPAIASRVAENLGGIYEYIFAPALVQSEQIRNSLLQEKNSKQVTHHWDKMDWVVLGIGNIPPYNPVSTLNFERALKAFIEETGEMPAAAVSLWFVTKDGHIPITEKSSCLIAAEPEKIKRARIRVGIAGGKRKVEAIKASLKTKLFNVLITEEQTAQVILSRSE